METSKTISVVIPSHNRHSCLEAALKSVFNQSLLPEEIIVIDDGSQPPVSDAIFQDAPAQVVCVLRRFDTPQGSNNARNMGITLATGSYIAFLDDDDEFHPEKLSFIVAAITADPSADVIYHPAVIRMVAESVEYISSLREFASRENAFSELLVMNRVGGTSMVVCRRELLLTVGMFSVCQPALQDYELWLRLARAGAKFLLLRQPLTFYYQVTRKASISKSLESNRRAIAMIEELYSKQYLELSEPDRKTHEVWKRRMVVHKALLNGKRFTAIKEQMRAVLILPSISNLLSLFALFLGASFVYRIRARFSK